MIEIIPVNDAANFTRNHRSNIGGVLERANEAIKRSAMKGLVTTEFFVHDSIGGDIAAYLIRAGYEVRHLKKFDGGTLLGVYWGHHVDS